MSQPLERIHKIFSESMFEIYKKRRYGIKSCRLTIDPDYAYDLLNLYQRGLELDCCGLTFSGNCSTTSIEEKIRTL